MGDDNPFTFQSYYQLHLPISYIRTNHSLDSFLSIAISALEHDKKMLAFNSTERGIKSSTEIQFQLLH